MFESFNRIEIIFLHLPPGDQLLLPRVRPARDGLNQLDPVEVLLPPGLPAQLGHLHGYTLGLGRGQSVVPQCFMNIIWFSEQ